jgi:hypothetical protein
MAPDIGPLVDRSHWEAAVALEAIKAYRAYLKGGGDDSRIPAMRFVDGQFSVDL